MAGWNGSHGRADARTAPMRRLRSLLELLEKRRAPAVTFDLGTGLLQVVGDEAGMTADRITLSVSEAGFVEIVFNGASLSSDPASGAFDTRLAGATASAVRAIGIIVGAGDDEIFLGDGFGAASGRVTLRGGPGHDLLVGGDAADSMLGGPGRDTLRGGPGDDVLRGMRGRDQLEADLGADRLHGGRGHDSLDAGADQDTLLGQAGNDTMTGGKGNDTMTGGEGMDSLDGGDDLDCVIQAAEFDQILTNSLLTGLGPDVLVGIEQARLSGGATHDRLDASGFTLGPVTLDGLEGDDTLLGGANDDLLLGGPDSDSLDGGAGMDGTAEVADFDQILTDSFWSGSETDSLVRIEQATLRGGAGDNRLDATQFTAGSVRLEGGAGDDLLLAGAGNDRLSGEAGRDTLTAGPGDDTLDGGLDSDLVIQTVDSDQTLISSDVPSMVDATATRLTGLGTDVLVGIEQASLSGGAGGYRLDASGFTLGPVTLVGLEGDDSLLGGASDDLLLGGPGSDSLDGGAGIDGTEESGDVDQILTNSFWIGSETDSLARVEQATLRGGAGDNRLDATQFTAGSVYLDGGDGDDTLSGGAGNDTLDGGPGNDLLTQSVDADQTLSDTGLTGHGSDQIRAMERAHLTGGAGNNVILASRFTFGSVTLEGGDGNDGLASGPGTDVLVGGPGDDTLSNEVGGGQDTLLGGDGNDRLRSGPDPRFGGSGGANLLDAGPGDDELIAFGSNDTLLGGPGADGPWATASRAGETGIADWNLSRLV